MGRLLTRLCVFVTLANLLLPLYSVPSVGATKLASIDGDPSRPTVPQGPSAARLLLDRLEALDPDVLAIEAVLAAAVDGPQDRGPSTILPAPVDLRPSLNAGASSGPHAVRPPILITSDGDLTATNGVVSGSGVPADPYLICGWDITAGTGVAAIWIQDITKSVRICDNLLHGTEVVVGLSRQQVFAAEGIRLLRTQDVEVLENTIQLVEVGISVKESPRTVLRANDVGTFRVAGIHVEGSNGATTSSNLLARGQTMAGFSITGIAIRSSTGVAITNDLFTATSLALDLTDSPNATLTGISTAASIVATRSPGLVAHNLSAMGLYLYSSNATVADLAAAGDPVAADWASTVRVHRVSGRIVHLDGPDSLVEDSLLTGINLGGDRSIARENSLTGSGTIYVSGDQTRLVWNTIQASHTAILVDGDDTIVSENTAQAGQFGAHLRGKRTQLSATSIMTSGTGVLVDTGASATVIADIDVSGGGACTVGIEMRSNHNEVRNVRTEKCAAGLLMVSGSANHVHDNSFANGTFGIQMWSIRAAFGTNIFRSNMMDGNSLGFSFDGLHPDEYAQDFGDTNLVDGVPVRFYVDLTDATVDGTGLPTYALYVARAVNTTILGFEFPTTYVGVVVAGGTNVVVRDVTVPNGYGVGVRVFGTTNVIVQAANIQGVVHGLQLGGTGVTGLYRSPPAGVLTSGVRVEGSEISNLLRGVSADVVMNLVILGNQIGPCGEIVPGFSTRGIFLFKTPGGLIDNNLIEDCGYGTSHHDNPSPALLRNNTIRANGLGSDIYGAGQRGIRIESNVYEGNQFGLVLTGLSANLDLRPDVRGNTFSRNTWGILYSHDNNNGLPRAGQGAITGNVFAENVIDLEMAFVTVPIVGNVFAGAEAASLRTWYANGTVLRNDFMAGVGAVVRTGGPMFEVFENRFYEIQGPAYWQNCTAPATSLANPSPPVACVGNITRNEFRGNDVGIIADYHPPPGTVGSVWFVGTVVDENSFTGNADAALWHRLGNTERLAAARNWWGATSGPAYDGGGNPLLANPGAGDQVRGSVEIRPWRAIEPGPLAGRAASLVAPASAATSSPVLLDASGTSGTNLSYFFLNGEGATSGWLSSPTWSTTYVGAGDRVAVVIVRDGSGQLRTATTQLTVLDQPPTVSIARTGDVFAGTFGDVDGTVVAYRWDLGDGTNLTRGRVPSGPAPQAIQVPRSEVGESPRWIVQGRDLETARVAVGTQGGVVLYEYPAIDAVLTSLSVSAAARLVSAPGIIAIDEDVPYSMMVEHSTRTVRADHAYAQHLRGTGAVIALLDTGVDPTHPDLVGRVLPGVNTMGSYDRPSDTYDDCGHGTHVASIAVGSGLSSGGVRHGIAPNARVLPIKVLGSESQTVHDECVGTTATVLAGLQWVHDHHAEHGIKIVSMSLGRPCIPGECRGTAPEDQLIDKLSDLGIVTVVAAGNVPNQRSIPADAKTAVTVGALDDRRDADPTNDVVADFSSRGMTDDGRKYVEVVAPGVDIVAAMARGGIMAGPWNGGRVVDGAYYRASGTSMAAPMVAAAIALLLEKQPDLTHAEILSTVNATARDIGAVGWDTASGYGVLDVEAALAATTGPEPTRPPVGLGPRLVTLTVWDTTGRSGQASAEVP